MSFVRRLVLSPGTTLCAEGKLLANIFIIDSGELCIQMQHPTEPNADPIDCGRFQCDEVIGLELFQTDAREMLAPFTATVLPDMEPCGIRAYTRESYIRAYGNPGLPLLMKSYEIALRKVIRMRDRIANRLKSG